MANWTGGRLTKAGRDLQIKVEAGQCKLELTKIKLGDGTEDISTIDTLTDLVEPKAGTCADLRGVFYARMPRSCYKVDLSVATVSYRPRVDCSDALASLVAFSGGSACRIHQKRHDAHAVRTENLDIFRRCRSCRAIRFHPAQDACTGIRSDARNRVFVADGVHLNLGEYAGIGSRRGRRPA